MKKNISKSLLVILLFFLVSSCFYLSQPSSVNAAADWAIPNLQIDIPGVTFLQSKACPAPNQNKTCVTWVGDYIGGVYKYLVGIAGILSAVILMVGGVMWIVAGGDAGRIGEAKAWIGASLTGLILVMTSYMILNMVNPDLLKFQPLQVNVAKEVRNNFVTCCSTKKGLVSGFTEVKDGKTTKPSCRVPDDKRDEYGSAAQFDPNTKKCEKVGDGYKIQAISKCSWADVGTTASGNNCSAMGTKYKSGTDKDCEGQTKYSKKGIITLCCCLK